MNPKFHEEPMHVRVNGGGADAKLRSDFLVLHPIEQAGHNLLLTPGQKVVRIHFLDLPQQPSQERNNLLRQRKFTFNRLPNGTDEGGCSVPDSAVAAGRK